MPATLRKMILIGGLCLLAPLSLAACGFTPIYAQKDLGVKLANIEVVVPDTRTGFFVRQNLLTAFNSTPTESKLYRLDITMRERRYDVGRQVDDTASRAEISTSVGYSLVDIRTKKVLTRGTFVDATTYDTSTLSPYAGVVGQKDGQERAATGISERIQSELTLFFYNQGQKAPAS